MAVLIWNTWALIVALGNRPDLREFLFWTIPLVMICSAGIWKDRKWAGVQIFVQFFVIMLIWR